MTGLEALQDKIDKLEIEELEQATKEKFVSFKDIIAPSFYRAYNLLVGGKVREAWFKGGRGSGKSSFISVFLVLDMLNDANLYKRGLIKKNQLSHTAVFRKIGSDIKDSVFSQILWSIDQLGVAPWFEVNKSNYTITLKPTRQMFQFRGLDDDIKVKSIKAPFGYYKNTWFEELAQFAGMKEIRSVKQSVQRGGHGFRTFCSYNPPMTTASWVNIEANEPVHGRYVFSSDYRSMPVQWLGEDFVIDAEDLKRRNEKLWRHEYLGEITGTGGAVFPNINIRHITDEEISHFDDLHYGCDWGFSNAFAWTASHYDRKRKRIIIFDEIYKPHLTHSLAAKLVLRKDMHGEPLYADCEDAAAIAEFNQTYGITTYPVVKGADSRRFGYKWLQGMFEIVIDPVRCPNCAREFQIMEFKQNKKTGEFLEDFPKEADHAIDATRYAYENEYMKRGLF